MVADCAQESSRMVPLIKVVKSAIVDTYGDINAVQQLYLHWGGRGFRKLQQEVLSSGVKKTLITVNKNTQTATLPLDFDRETFVGVINDQGQKVPLGVSKNLASDCELDTINSEDRCNSCGQDKTICEDLSITEEVTLVEIDGNTYEDKVIKKLYPNGDYYLETTKNILDLQNGGVSPLVTKEFITNLELKPCGCLETTEENISKIKSNCYDTYCCHYSSCCNSKADYGYKIFEEKGLIGFDFNFPFDKIYLEYTGYLPKRNGQFVVPEVAFETLVNYIKFKSVENNKSVSMSDRQWHFNQYMRERGNMMKMKSRVFLSDIRNAMRRAPKFNIDFGDTWYGCFATSSNNNLVSTVAASGTSSSSGGNTTIIINNASYELAVRVGNGTGHPTPGQSLYQNNLLIGATDLEVIYLAKQILTKIDGDFTFNQVSGTIDISPNQFLEPDSLIVPYNKKS